MNTLANRVAANSGVNRKGRIYVTWWSTVILAALNQQAIADTPPYTLRTVLLSGQTIPGLPGARIPFNYHPAALLAPQINNAGQLLFVCGTGSSSGEAIVSGTPDNLRLVAASHQPAPNTEAGTVFDYFYVDTSNIRGPRAMNERGEVAFDARLVVNSGNPFGNGLGLFTESGGGTRLAAREGTQAPGLNAGIKFSSFGDLQLSDDGRLKLRDGNANWLVTPDHTMHLLVTNGLATPGIPNGTFSDAVVTQPNTGPAYVLANANIPISAFSTRTVSAIWRGDSYETLTKVFDGRGPIPNIPNLIDVTFSNSLAEANNTGQFAFNGILRTNEISGPLTQNGLFVLQADGNLRTIAVANQHAPDLPTGAIFSDNVFTFEINDSGETAFWASTATPGDAFQRRALFSERQGQTRLVALANQYAPGTPAGVVFGNIASGSHVADVFSPPAFNNAGQLAFLAELDGIGVGEQNNVGIWATDSAGVPTLLAREGNPIEVAPGDFRTVAELQFVGGKGDGQNYLTGLNDSGIVTFSARFTDGSSGLFTAQLVTVPEASTSLLAIIGFCAVLFNRLRMAGGTA